MGRFVEGNALPLDVERAMELLRAVGEGRIRKQCDPNGKYEWVQGTAEFSAERYPQFWKFYPPELERLKMAGMVTFGPEQRPRKYREGGQYSVTREARLAPRGRAFLDSGGIGWERLPILIEIWDEGDHRRRGRRAQFVEYVGISGR
jgi:hypothetical protein